MNSKMFPQKKKKKKKKEEMKNTQIQRTLSQISSSKLH